MANPLSSLVSFLCSVGDSHFLPGFTADIDLSYKYWGNMPKVYEFLQYLIVPTVFLCLVLGLAKLILFLVRKVKDKPVQIRDADLYEILQVADRERSRFDLVFGNVKPIPCALRELERSRLLLEAPSYLNLTKKYIGRDVRCFFKTNVPDKVTGKNFYYFHTQILDVAVVEDDIKVVTIGLPALLNTGQQREFFRYRPPGAYIIGVAIWTDAYYSENVQKLPPPRCKLEGEGDYKGYMVNISAGGMLLAIDRSHIIHCGLPLDAGKRWFIQVTLLGLENDLLRVWLLCRVMTVLDTSVGKFEIALRFSGFAFHNEAPGPLQWRTIPDDGVPPIARWVLKRSVEPRPIEE